MDHLMPEKRADKNGRLVTRYVNPSVRNQSGMKGIPQPVVPGSSARRYTCTECRAVLERGYNHRCVVENLMPLSGATVKVLDACREAGGLPLLVGGCVRDALLSRSGKATLSKDVDIEVYGVPDATTLIASLSRVAVVNEVGIRFGVLKVRLDGEDFDVALPRRDSKIGTGHRGFDTVVEPSLDEATAFGRRDYTINAMGYDPETQELVDPYGGTADLAAGILRHTTNAFDEDPIRVLRGVQFAARFGFDIAPETQVFAQSLKDEYAKIPVEGIWAEMDKLFTKGKSISHGLKALHQTGWEEHFPELAAIRDVPQDPTWHPEGPVHVHAALSGDAAVRIADRDGLDDEGRRLVVLAATIHDLGKAIDTQVSEDGKITSHGHDVSGVDAARGFLKSIGAPAALQDKVLPIIREHMCMHSIDSGKLTASTVRRMLRRLEGENGRGPTIQDWARVVEADLSGRSLGDSKGKTDEWLSVAESVGPEMKPILRGNHLIDIGMKPGPEFSKIIKASLVAQDNGDFNDVDGALKWFRENYPG
jgi:tRNA nucleotidyltransferase (CCA-adding enzyme)